MDAPLFTLDALELPSLSDAWFPSERFPPCAVSTSDPVEVRRFPLVLSFGSSREAQTFSTSTRKSDCDIGAKSTVVAYVCPSIDSSCRRDCVSQILLV